MIPAGCKSELHQGHHGSPPRLISVQRSAAFVIVTTTTSPLASASHCAEKGRDVPHAHAWLFLLKSFSLGSMSASIVEEKAQEICRTGHESILHSIPKKNRVRHVGTVSSVFEDCHYLDIQIAGQTSNQSEKRRWENGVRRALKVCAGCLNLLNSFSWSIQRGTNQSFSF